MLALMSMCDPQPRKECPHGACRPPVLGAVRATGTRHRPLPGDVKVQDAPFWTPAQAKALRDMLLEDADWAPVVDQLNLALH